MMYKRYIQQSLAYILLLLGAIFLFPHITFALEKQESVITSPDEEPRQVQIIPRSTLSKEQTKELLTGKEYISATLTSVIDLGEDEITDFVIKGPKESVDEVDKKFREQRGALLTNLLETRNLSQEKASTMQKQYPRHSIEQALRGNSQQALKIREIRVTLSDKNQADAFEVSLPDKSYIRQVRQQDIDAAKERRDIEQKIQNNGKRETPSEGTSAEISILDNIQSNLLTFMQPVEVALASSTPSWVPDYTSISFFDTDEIGTHPFEWWRDIDNATTYQRPDAVSHWWRTYIIHRGADDYPYFGKYIDEEGTNFSGWSKMNYPYATSDSYHSLSSHNDRLFHAVKGSSGEMFIRDSWDGGDTWNEFRSIGRYTTTGFDLVSHNGDLCIAHKGRNNNHIYVGCATDGWWDWSSTTWYDTGSFRTNKQPALASTFGTLWLGHTGTDNVVYLTSSYDNGQTWNPSFSINNRSSSSGVSMVGIGDQNWENERLCVLRRGTNDEMYQSCLYRYGPNYNQWNWHPWQLQQGQTNDIPVLVSDSSRIGQIHRTMVNNVESRTVEWVNPGGRGYISHMRWDEDPGFGSNNGYEHKVYLNRYQYSSPNYNDDRKLYLDKQDEGNIPSIPPNACIPIFRYWASNLPGAYLDTRLNQDGTCDSSGNEVSYAIGAEFGHMIQQNQYYFTYINTYKGDLYKPIFKLQSHLTELQYWNPLSFGYDGTWAAFKIDIFNVSNHPSNPSDVWVNYHNQGNNYPYWYYEKSL